MVIVMVIIWRVFFNGGEGPTFPSTRAAGKGNYPYNVEIIPYINIIK